MKGRAGLRGDGPGWAVPCGDGLGGRWAFGLPPQPEVFFFSFFSFFL